MGITEFIVLCFLGSAIFWLVQKFLNFAWSIFFVIPAGLLSDALQYLSIRVAGYLQTRKH